MKIVVLGTDTTVCDAGSAVAKRIIQYAELVEQYTVIVPGKQQKSASIGGNAMALCSGGENKVMQLMAVYRLTKQHVIKYQPEVISSQDPFYLGVVAVLLGRKHHLGVEIQVHGWERVTWLRKVIAKFVLKRADLVRTVSKRMAQQLHEEFGLPSQKIVSIPIATTVEARAQKNVQNKTGLIVLAVGRLVPVKRFDLLLQAFTKLERPDWSLRIVGDGPEKAALEQLSIRLKLGERVQFVGGLTYAELQNEYALADVFALSSDSEGWGMVVVEAAAHGLPIVMTDVGVAGEVIQNGKEGLIVEPDNVEAFAHALEQMDSAELREQLGAAAQKRVQQLPDAEETRQQYLKNWKQIAKRV